MADAEPPSDQPAEETETTVPQDPPSTAEGTEKTGVPTEEAGKPVVEGSNDQGDEVKAKDESKPEKESATAAATDGEGDKTEAAPAEEMNGDGEATKPEESPTVETPTPKRKRGRPPKRKTPQSGATDTPTVKTPSSTRSSKRKTPESARSGASALSSISSTKRQRKAATAFEPENFKAVSVNDLKQCPQGRGVALSSLEKVKASISKNKDDPILAALYKFIFSTMGLTGRGKAPAGNMKSSLMEFSGFLIPDDGGSSAEGEAEKMEVDGEGEKDEVEEKKSVEEKNTEMKEKFEAKAAELTDALLKSFLSFLHIERPTRMSKEERISKLLEFLAEPSESLVEETPQSEKVVKVIAKSSEVRKKRGRPPKNQSVSTTSTPDSSKPKAKRGRGRPKKIVSTADEDAVADDTEVVEEKEEEEELNDDDNDEIIDGQTIPSAKKLRKWVKAYVTCFDLDKCNAKHAITTASEKFKVDLTVKKNTLMEMLKDEITSN
jgi:hypothetical protein